MFQRSRSNTCYRRTLIDRSNSFDSFFQDNSLTIQLLHSFLMNLSLQIVSQLTKSFDRYVLCHLNRHAFLAQQLEQEAMLHCTLIRIDNRSDIELLSRVLVLALPVGIDSRCSIRLSNSDVDKILSSQPIGHDLLST